MNNNFEEKRKDIDISTIDSETYQRKILEVTEKYNIKRESINEMYMRELQLANNNEEEIIRRTKIRDIEKDHANNLYKLEQEQYKELEDIRNKYDKEYSKPYYFKWIYIGDVGKYDRIVCGLSYYIKLNEFDVIDVYDDVKYSKFILSTKYIPEEWREEHEHKGDIK